MAEILEGRTNHATWAPLSHAQTLAINKHLQEQITTLEDRLEALLKAQRDADTGISGLSEGLNGTNSRLQDIANGLASTNGDVSTITKDLRQTNGNVAKLRSGLEDSNENIGALKEGQRVTRANLQKVGQDLSANVALTGRLQEALEKRVFTDIASLKDGLAKTDLHLEKARKDHAQTKEELQAEKDALRALTAEQQGTRNDLLKTNTVVHILEQRLQDTAGGLKSTKQKVEELSDMARKLREGLEHARAGVSENATGLQKAGSHIQQVNEGLDGACKALNALQGKLEGACGSLENQRREVDRNGDTINELKEGQSRMNSLLHQLRADLNEVGNMAHATQSGLKDTNAMVLPNLNLGSHGSQSARKSPSTPSIKKVQGGTAPNRMAWI